MKILKEYFELEKKIHEYFGYVEDWVTIPLLDQTDSYWYYDEYFVLYSSKPLTLEVVRPGKEIHSGSLYTQRFLPKWYYRGEEYTMISIDTHCDGNKYLMVFDNSKELVNPDEELKEALKRWM